MWKSLVCLWAIIAVAYATADVMELADGPEEMMGAPMYANEATYEEDTTVHLNPVRDGVRASCWLTFTLVLIEGALLLFRNAG